MWRMFLDVILLLLSLVIILAGAEVFTNSVEWLGKKLNLGAGAVGSILAAVGTALPETLIPVIAILFGGHGTGGHDVGIGAILGAPFMLGTLAMFVTAVAAFVKRKGKNTPMLIIPEVMKRDMKFFIIVYSIAIAASFLPIRALKLACIVFLIGAYVYYVYNTLKSSMGQHDDDESLNPMYFMRKSDDPPLLLVLLQLAVALGIIIGGANLFVSSVQVVATALNVPVLILSLIITPIATELPEKFNSVIWTMRSKDTLALGNITGAMVFQSSLIPALGILLTEWELEPIALLSAILALTSILYQISGLYGKHKLKPSHLLVGGLFYAAFIVVIATGIL
jgi:cation:H+ antiporter